MQRADGRVTSSKQTVIMSCGVLGASIAAALAEKGHTVTILDPRAEAFDRLSRPLTTPGSVTAESFRQRLDAGPLPPVLEQLGGSVPDSP